MSGCGGSSFTEPCQIPARLLRASKDFSAAEGATGLGALCTSDCAKVTVGSEIRTTESTKRTDLMFLSPLYPLTSGPRFNFEPSGAARLITVIHNYNTRTHVKSFFSLFCLAAPRGQ